MVHAPTGAAAAVLAALCAESEAALGPVMAVAAAFEYCWMLQVVLPARQVCRPPMSVARRAEEVHVLTQAAAVVQMTAVAAVQMTAVAAVQMAAEVEPSTHLRRQGRPFSFGPLAISGRVGVHA